MHRLPSDALTMAVGSLTTLDHPIILINVNSNINGSDNVVNDLHKAGCISTQIKSLARVSIDVPAVASKAFVFVVLKLRESEVE